MRKNLRKIIERLMMRYLRRQGWIVFWLEPEAQHCPALKPENNFSECWLALYLQGEKMQQQYMKKD